MKQKNQIELLGIYGSDKTHALSAWTSTSRDLDSEKESRILSLIRYLIKSGHETPFEKSSIHFLVTAEIASHIHLLKHRIGVSINAESARYKELVEDKFYIPEDWPSEEQIALEAHCLECFDKYHQVLERLTPVLGRKRAKESARFYLPYSTQLVFDVMFNFRSFMHFLGLRKKDEAQNEIHKIADQMLELVEATGLFTYSIQAFQDYILDGPKLTKYDLEILSEVLRSTTTTYLREEIQEIIQKQIDNHPQMSAREKKENRLISLLFKEENND